MGISEGGPATMVFAATRPERTRALVLTGTAAYVPSNSWEDVDRDPAELRARGLVELGEEYTPSVDQIAGTRSSARRSVGLGQRRSPQVRHSSAPSARQLGMLERMSASPGMARATLEATFHMDVRSVLSAISAPTLVVHAKADPIAPVQFGQYLADNIPGARMVEVDGADHAPWMTDPDRVATEVEELLTGRPCSTGAVTTCSPYGVVHRHRRVDGTRGRGG